MFFEDPNTTRIYISWNISSPTKKSDSTDESNDSPEEKLTKLAELKEKGLIDEEDYNSKKEEILKTI